MTGVLAVCRRLNDNSLAGTIPTELGSLTSLTDLCVPHPLIFSDSLPGSAGGPQHRHQESVNSNETSVSIMNCNREQQQ